MRELKIHLLRPDDNALAMCGKITENSTDDPEEISCKSCSGMYRTNVEWYSQVRNKAVEARGLTGEGDIYTRTDVEVGLHRLGWDSQAIDALLDNTRIFRNIHLATGQPLGENAWSALDRVGMSI